VTRKVRHIENQMEGGSSGSSLKRVVWQRQRLQIPVNGVIFDHWDSSNGTEGGRCHQRGELGVDKRLKERKMGAIVASLMHHDVHTWKGPDLVRHTEGKGRRGEGSPVAQCVPEQGPQWVATAGRGGGERRSVRQGIGGAGVRYGYCWHVGWPGKEGKKEVGPTAMGPSPLEQCQFSINVIFKPIKICNGPKMP
jgi:hypothetical protein